MSGDAKTPCADENDFHRFGHGRHRGLFQMDLKSSRMPNPKMAAPHATAMTNSALAVVLVEGWMSKKTNGMIGARAIKPMRVLYPIGPESDDEYLSKPRNDMRRSLPDWTSKATASFDLSHQPRNLPQV
jgi:hypothetical protein